MIEFIKEGYKKRSLQWTISLSFTAISILSIASMAIAFYSHSINTIRENTIKENEQIVCSYPTYEWACMRDNINAAKNEAAPTLNQAKEFHEATNVDGVILTKMDGSAKGGIAIAIESELHIPVKYIGVGEAVEDLQKFDADSFVEALFAGNDHVTEGENEDADA